MAKMTAKVTTPRPPPPASYLLRHGDPALWRKVKARAAKDDKSLHEVIMERVRAYAHGD